MKALNGKLEASETIRATDLVKLMNVVEAAIGVYNALEMAGDARPAVWAEYLVLGQKLRELGLNEVTDDES